MEKQELDTSWFDLKNYEKLNELDLAGWYSLLSHRITLLSLINHQNGAIKKKMSLGKDAEEIINSLAKAIKECPYDANEQLGFKKKINNYYPFNTYSVKSSTVFDIYFCGNLSKLNDIWEAIESSSLSFFFESKTMSFNVLLKERNLLSISECYGNHYVSVDLSATNEQIMSDFHHWLTEYRNYIGDEAIKKNNSTRPLKLFTAKEMAEWEKHRILPYLDLTLISLWEGKKIKQEKLAELIFPDKHYSNPDEKLKKTVKPIADWLISKATLKAIEAQLATN